MTKAEKSNYKKMDTIAVHSSFGGIEIKKIWFGIYETVVCVAGTLCDNKKLHTVHECKIYYGDRPYFKLYNRRIHLDECVRVR